MASLTRRGKWWIGAAAVLVAAVASSLLYVDFLGARQAQRRIVVERAYTLLNSLAAGIRAQSRMGRYRPERLSAIFEEVGAGPGVLGLRLEGPSGGLLASAGPNPAFETPRQPGVGWHGEYMTASTDVRFTGRRGPPEEGRGRRGWYTHDDALEEHPWDEEDYRLAVALDTRPMQTEIRRSAVGRLIIALALAAAAALGAVLAANRLRQRDLRAELALARERSAHLERLAQLGAGLAHETKNPLGVVRGLAQSIVDTPGTQADVKRMASDIVDEADRTVRQISTFMKLARPEPPAPGTIDLDVFFEAFLPLLRTEAAGTSVTVDYEPAGVTVLADEALLRRALLNLVSNAVRACGDRGQVTIAAGQREGTTVLTVTDTGRGIPAENLERVTEPYFTTEADGHGLGLAIVQEIADAHGWLIEFESAQGAGTRVTLRNIQEPDKV